MGLSVPDTVAQDAADVDGVPLDDDLDGAPLDMST